MANRLSPLIPFLLIVVTFAAITFGTSAATAEESPPCLICGKAAASDDHSVHYKGRSIPLCSPACQDRFRELERTGALDPLTAKLEPRAALFQADSAPNRMGPGGVPFWAGLYVLLGVIVGGGAAYAAVRKGIPAGSSFALGFALNLVGLAIVMARPSRETKFHAKGFRKVPTTRASLSCPACGKANHPSARACIHCGRALEPASQSEVSPT